MLSEYLSTTTLNRSTADRVYDALRQAILSKGLAPGDQLVEAKVAKDLQVSITPVRQAFQTLTTQGLLTSFPYKGTYVTHITRESVADMQYVRMLLEPAAAELAFDFLSPKDADYLTCLCEQEDTAYQNGELYKAIELDTSVHEYFLKKSGSALLMETWNLLKNRMELIQAYTKFGKRPKGYYVARHQMIIDAVRAHDKPMLINALINHIRNANSESGVQFLSEAEVHYK